MDFLLNELYGYTSSGCCFMHTLRADISRYFIDVNSTHGGHSSI